MVIYYILFLGYGTPYGSYGGYHLQAARKTQGGNFAHLLLISDLFYAVRRLVASIWECD